MRIENCFDSHAHWLATGEHQSRLLLYDLTCGDDVKKLNVIAPHFRGQWLTGFGWDQTKWTTDHNLHRRVLDEVFPDYPVAFSRVDGHAYWCNTMALKMAGLPCDITDPIPEIAGGKIEVDSEGLPTGVLIDVAKNWVDRVMPEPSAEDIKNALQKGAKIFNQAGFTHIRDMTCSELQWEQSLILDKAGELNLAVEQYFCAEDPADFSKALGLALRAKKNFSQNLKPQGTKIYLDGALGSEGALISQNYFGSMDNGLKLLTEEQITECTRRSWENDLDIAIHTIGDEAAHIVVSTVNKLWDSGISGRLHLEHAQMLRPETIELMKNKNIVCHIQPCHWLSDKRWLKQKLGDLFQYVFPWRELEENDIAFDFGSDSPIEVPSVRDNIVAVEDAANAGISKPSQESVSYHSYPDKSWAPETYSEFSDGRATKVVFRGQEIYKS